MNAPDVDAKRKNRTENLPKYDKDKFVFLDESGINTNLTRIYGRAVGGNRCADKTPLNTPKNTTEWRNSIHDISGRYNKR